MTDFSLVELKLLVSRETSPCISIYMPVGRTNVRPQQQMARLNYFLKQAEEHLVEMKMRRLDAESILAPASALINNYEFGQQPHEGIALFLAHGFFRYFEYKSIAIEFSEMVTVGDQFQIKPLLPLLTGIRQFYILALKQKHIDLFRGTRDTIKPINLDSAPCDIHEALGEEMSDIEMQGHPIDVGDHQEQFGAYDPGSKEKDYILRYCRAMNNIIHKTLADGQAPLILAGTENQQSIYCEANTYPHLLDQGIERNVEHLPAEELHRLAWEIVESVFRHAGEHALDSFRQNVNTGQPTYQLVATLDSAHVESVNTFIEVRPHFYQLDENHQEMRNNVRVAFDKGSIGDRYG